MNAWVYNTEQQYIASTGYKNKTNNIFLTMINNNPCKHMNRDSEEVKDYKLLDEIDIYEKI